MKLTPPPSLRGLPSQVWVLAAARFTSAVSAFVMLFLVLYLTGPRGLAVDQAGLLAGANGAGLLLGNLTGGRLGDRAGHRRTMLGASAFAGAATIAVPWLPVGLLAVILPLIGYLGATAGVSQGALAALAVPVGERRTAVAVSRAASNAGFVLGPLIGALLVAHSFEALFVVEGAATLLTRAVVARLLPREVVSPSPEDRVTGLVRSLLADRSLLALLPAVVMTDLVYRQLYTTLPVYLRDHGQPVGLYTALIAVGSGLILCLEVPAAVTLRRRPALPVVASGYALVGVGFGVLGLGVVDIGSVAVPVAAAAVLGMVVLTAGEILYKTTATAHVLDSAPMHLVGQYQGLYTAAATSGTMLAGPVGGVVYAQAPAALWPSCAAVAIGAAALAQVAHRRLGPRAPATASALSS